MSQQANGRLYLRHAPIFSDYLQESESQLGVMLVREGIAGVHYSDMINGDLVSGIGEDLGCKIFQHSSDGGFRWRSIFFAYN